MYNEKENTTETVNEVDTVTATPEEKEQVNNDMENLKKADVPVSVGLKQEQANEVLDKFMEKNKVTDTSTPPPDPNINPETGKAYTQNERVRKLTVDMCTANGITMRDVAVTLAESLQKQIRLQEKDRDVFKTARQGLEAKAEYYELVAREVTAHKIIDGHEAEMKQYQEQYIHSVVKNLILAAKTDEEKVVSERVAEMSGYKLKDMKAAIDASVADMAHAMFKKWVEQEKSLNKDTCCNPKKKGWFSR